MGFFEQYDKIDLLLILGFVLFVAVLVWVIFG